MLTLRTLEQADFREHERRIVAERLATLFGDVDEFPTLLKSVCHRRRPRAGLAPENHLRTIFKRNGVLHGFNIERRGSRNPTFSYPESTRIAVLR